MRKLIWLEAALIFLLLFFSLSLILFCSVLPRYGMVVYWSVNGVSMNPTITEGTLIVGKHTPFDELQVGDIIVFKDRVTTKHVSTGLRKEGETGEAIPSEEPKVVYLEGRTITHRIVSTEDGIRTKGDNNKHEDQYPVTEDGYVAKIVWWNNWLGWPFFVMYEDYGLFWLIGAVVVNGIVLIAYSVHHKAQISKNQENCRK